MLSTYILLHYHSLRSVLLSKILKNPVTNYTIICISKKSPDNCSGFLLLHCE